MLSSPELIRTTDYRCAVFALALWLAGSGLGLAAGLKRPWHCPKLDSWLYIRTEYAVQSDGLVAL